LGSIAVDYFGFVPVYVIIRWRRLWKWHGFRKERGALMADKYEYIVDIANRDTNIRGVLLYGSRANSEVQPDSYQDYDIYYIVKDKEAFDFSIFKNVVLRFVPSKVYPELFPNETTHLMLFETGERIDLTITTLKDFKAKAHTFEFCKCLLDKDGQLLEFNANNHCEFWVKPIDKTTFDNTCAEFYWEIQNVVKGLKRDHLSYTMFLRDIALRDMLNCMVDTYIGMLTDYSVSVGTLGRYRKSFLPKQYYEIYERTYLSNTVDDVWDSLFYMVDLFSLLGKHIAEKYDWDYSERTELFVRQYLQSVRDQ